MFRLVKSASLNINLVKKFVCFFVGCLKSSTFAFAFQTKEDWQSDRMRWTRNPVYPLPGIGGLNPSSSAKLFSIQKIRREQLLAPADLFFMIICFLFG